MEVSWCNDPATGRLEFKGHVDEFALGRLKLDKLDQATILTPIVSAADFFQTLEILFRRMAEQCPTNPARDLGER